MITIETKLLRGTFYTYATIDGYDYSFGGTTIEESQKQMRELLDKKYQQGKIKGGVEWDPIRVIEEPEKVNLPPYVGYASMRIDHNPID